MVLKFLQSLFGNPVDRAAHNLYVEAVNQARHPAFYVEGGVADTLDGRFDLIVLHLWLIVTRLHNLSGAAEGSRAKAKMVEKKLISVHHADMDQALREMGVGDLSVGKKVKDMAQAFFGRCLAYDNAWKIVEHDRSNVQELADALIRNVYREEPPSESQLNWLVDYVIGARWSVGGQSLDQITKGEVVFPEVHSSAAS